MANYTGLSDLKNKPHRSGFDLSKKVLFTAKAGELLPVYWDIAIPGDKYSLKPRVLSLLNHRLIHELGSILMFMRYPCLFFGSLPLLR